MFEINNKEKTTFKEVIHKYVRPGSIVWTDGHKSYNWLTTDPRYIHITKSKYGSVEETGLRMGSDDKCYYLEDNVWKCGDGSGPLKDLDVIFGPKQFAEHMYEHYLVIYSKSFFCKAGCRRGQCLN